MADPRKNCCPKSTARESQLQQRKKGLFDAARTVGNLEGLNDVGFGSVRAGLETVAAVSDSIRSGSSVVPGREDQDVFNSTLGKIAGTAADSVETGANAILDATGIGRGVLDTVNGVDANVANRALGAAKSIFQQAKQGNFQISDIPGVFQDLQNLEILGRSIFTPTDFESTQLNGLNKALCRPSPWAIDLVKNNSPRYKFLYIVDIKFSPAYSEWNKSLASGLAFITKSSGRPQVDFEYDDVNMYNFWTKVIKRTIFAPLNMRFIDDQDNNALQFYAAYMKAMSPITNKNFRNDRTQSGGQGGHGVTGTYESDSMNFENKSDDQDIYGKNFPAYSSSVGALDKDVNGNSTKNLLSSITLYHVGNFGNSITAFHMFNPKITSLQPDEVNMADNGDGNEFVFEFNYDSLYVDPNIPVEVFGVSRLSELSGGNVGATYAINTIPAPTSGGNKSSV